jgi:hypothetical protein
MRRALMTALAAVLAMSACSSPEAAQEVLVGTTSAPAPTTSPATETDFVTGLTIPWAVGGMRHFRDGTSKHQAGEWPNAKVPAIRLWDGFTTWANLEPQQGTWKFARLDRFVDTAISNGTTDIALVLAGTPQWAATKKTSTDAPWIGPGSASFPKDVDLWRQYVATVAQRYKGRITAYEIGNEPNMPMFWTGTDAQYQLLVEVAAHEISTIDPDATIVAQAGLIRRPKDLRALATITTDLSTIDGIDVISVHFYPRAKRLDEAADLISGARAVIDASDTGQRASWVTEVNVSKAGDLTKPQQANAITQLTDAMQQAGFARSYWYSWTIEGAPGFIPIHQGTPAARALFGQLRQEDHSR